MRIRLHLFIFLSVCFFSEVLLAQPEKFQPEFTRQLFHERLDKAQQDLLAIDGKNDGKITVYASEEMNQQLEYLITTRIDAFQRRTETSTKLEHGQKLTYLRGMTELLYAFAAELRKKQLDWSQFGELVNAYESSLMRLESKQSLLPVVRPLPYDAAKLIAGNFAFRESAGIVELNEALFLKYIELYPEKTLRRLVENPNYRFTDSLIAVSAKRRPEELVTYAQARGTQLAAKIAAHPDPLVKMIYELANDKSGQLYFPFIDHMVRGDLNKADIQRAVRDSSQYYSLLVKTAVANAGRMLQGDTPVVTRSLTEMLHVKSLEVYVNTINGLHDEPASIRFRKIQGLNAQELYYLIVLNEAEIYTSSYMYVYNRMMELTPGNSADTLLQLVNYDHFKKFLTMAANYNTLNNFLAKMSSQQATQLMTNYVNNLDKGKSKDDIEDAVDVANAYASIRQPEIRKLMLDQVKKNYNDALSWNNKKGIIVYRLEKVIMESSDAQLDSTLTAVNISDSLGIPPVFEIKNQQLRDEKGRIVLQMYFYGDASGKGTFNHFMRLYSDRTKWAMNATPQWVQYTSIGAPVPFVLFANRALDEENDEDEKAAEALIQWMNENGYKPSISVHRGHSYYLPYTIEKLLPSKVVVLGSCGAYHNLADVLKTSPDAYIISSKQVGYGEINVALFTYLVDRLKAGKDVKWPAMMSEVAGRISADKQSGYDDYVFPHQNLGALFIKAYKIANSSDDPFNGMTAR